MTDSNIRKTGTITRWVRARGFGFLEVQNGSAHPESFFLHVTELKGDPQYGATVEFDVDPVRQGKFYSAVNAVVVRTNDEGAR